MRKWIWAWVGLPGPVSIKVPILESSSSQGLRRLDIFEIFEGDLEGGAMFGGFEFAAEGLAADAALALAGTFGGFFAAQPKKRWPDNANGARVARMAQKSVQEDKERDFIVHVSLYFYYLVVYMICESIVIVLLVYKTSLGYTTKVH